jgi:hypothetical protein
MSCTHRVFFFLSPKLPVHAHGRSLRPAVELAGALTRWRTHAVDPASRLAGQALVPLHPNLPLGGTLTSESLSGGRGAVLSSGRRRDGAVLRGLPSSPTRAVASYASARLYQHHTTLDELKKLIATLSTNVTTLAIDVSVRNVVPTLTSSKRCGLSLNGRC